MSDEIRTPVEALEAAGELVWNMSERTDLCAAIRALADRIPTAPDDEALVSKIVFGMRVRESVAFIEHPENVALAVIAALREAGALR